MEIQICTWLQFVSFIQCLLSVKLSERLFCEIKPFVLAVLVLALSNALFLWWFIVCVCVIYCVFVFLATPQCLSVVGRFGGLVCLYVADPGTVVVLVEVVGLILFRKVAIAISIC